MEMLERIKVRIEIDKDSTEKDDLLNEYIKTAQDRIALRVGLTTFPDALETIAVDVVVKMYNRKGAEGVESEKLDVISTTYVDKLLEEYSEEFTAFKNGLLADIKDAKPNNWGRLM